MKKIILLLLGVVIVWKLFNHSGDVVLGPGVMVSEFPKQFKINSPPHFELDEYQITEIAEFEIKAKVLSKENYYFGREADLSPTDLALGWASMSDESVLKEIQISQSGRFYYWRVKSFPISRKEIETQSANMHLIPANDSVKRAVDRVRKGQVIEISGSLVNVLSKDDGWYWKSSQTRNDTGSGACELIYVTSINVITL